MSVLRWPSKPPKELPPSMPELRWYRLENFPTAVVVSLRADSPFFTIAKNRVYFEHGDRSESWNVEWNNETKRYDFTKNELIGGDSSQPRCRLFQQVLREVIIGSGHLVPVLSKFNTCVRKAIAFAALEGILSNKGALYLVTRTSNSDFSTKEVTLALGYSACAIDPEFSYLTMDREFPGGYRSPPKPRVSRYDRPWVI